MSILRLSTHADAFHIGGDAAPATPGPRYANKRPAVRRWGKATQLVLAANRLVNGMQTAVVQNEWFRLNAEAVFTCAFTPLFDVMERTALAVPSDMSFLGDTDHAFFGPLIALRRVWRHEGG